jgi:hypothetical protein
MRKHYVAVIHNDENGFNISFLIFRRHYPRANPR